MPKITDQLQRIECLLQMIADDALWTTDHLCAYFSRSKSTINQHILTLPDFPKATFIPGIKKPYWNADEVKAWANTQKRKKL